MRPLTEALLARRKVAFDYPGPDGVKSRTVTPYGIIAGYRVYLVARVDSASGDNPTRWRIDRMRNVKALEEAAIVPAEFSLAAHARRAFGAYYNDNEYGEVEWRFSPAVADNVNSFRFHPDQKLTTEPDGSVTVRFMASGVLEMAWALYPWGDKVEVIKPEALRRMVDGYRRSDFPAVP
jgi:predicted DNA-binding transcriptional regulator YafY